MKLSKCNIGAVVYSPDYGVGHVVGVAYNCSTFFALKMPISERIGCTIVVVKFAHETTAIHPANIELFKD